MLVLITSETMLWSPANSFSFIPKRTIAPAIRPLHRFGLRTVFFVSPESASVASFSSSIGEVLSELSSAASGSVATSPAVLLFLKYASFMN